MKVIIDQWAHNARQQEFDVAVREEVARMPAGKARDMTADLLVLLFKKCVLTPAEITEMLGADWELPE